MAIRIEAQLAKKLPIPGADFSSQQAAITISAEVSDPTRVVDEAARLYRLCEASVDAQLGIAAAPTSQVDPAYDRGVVHHHISATNGHAQRASYPQRDRSSGGANSGAPRSNGRSYNGPRGNGRRGAPPPISDAQQRLLHRLFKGCDDHGRSWLQDQGVENVDQLDMRQASELIDTLKGGDR